MEVKDCVVGDLYILIEDSDDVDYNGKLFYVVDKGYSGNRHRATINVLGYDFCQYGNYSLYDDDVFLPATNLHKILYGVSVNDSTEVKRHGAK